MPIESQYKNPDLQTSIYQQTQLTMAMLMANNFPESNINSPWLTSLFIDKYRLKDRLAIGKSSEVYWATNKWGDQQLAIKRLTYTEKSDLPYLYAFISEVFTGHEISSQTDLEKWFVKPIDFGWNSNFGVFSVYPLLPTLETQKITGLNPEYLNVHSFIASSSEAIKHKPQILQEHIQLSMGYIQDISSGLDSLHKKGLGHNDIHASNILIPMHGTSGIRILDLGLSSASINFLTRTKTGPGYIIKNISRTNNNDVRQLGILSLNLLSLSDLKNYEFSESIHKLKQLTAETTYLKPEMLDVISSAINGSISSPLEFAESLKSSF